MILSQSRLAGNFTAGYRAYGGAIFSDSGAVTINEGSTLSGNSTKGFRSNAGAIGALAGVVTVAESTLSGNSTAGDGARRSNLRLLRPSNGE